MVLGWPWLPQAIALVICVVTALHFPMERDHEFPGVDRPTFSAFPPATYRLAEPGDTLDRVAMYTSALGVTLAGLGWLRSRRSVARNSRSLWLAACGLFLLSAWDAATPWPTFDGWHGLGWETISNPMAPTTLRILVAVAGVLLVGLILYNIKWRELRPARVLGVLRVRRVALLLGLGVVLAIAGRVGLPALEPERYWSGWARIGSLFALTAVLIRFLPPARPRPWPRLTALAQIAVPTAFLVSVGLYSFWLHRPIDRLREVADGKVFISAMPRPEGLPVAHRRHKFKTIINLFQEDLPGLRSPYHEEEVEFARKNGIHYIGSPLGAIHADDFLDETLRLAQDPKAWPILVHCHGCMDRTPAWWGIYQFLIEEKSLAEVLQSIEQHRGSRPKASVTLLYNRAIEARAPERYRADPTGRVLMESAAGVIDPYFAQLAEELEEEARTLSRVGDSNSSGQRRE